MLSCEPRNRRRRLTARWRRLSCLAHPQVPPYAQAGLYKQLATLKDLVREFREDATKNASLRPVIAANMEQAGLYEDLPYPGSGGDGGVLTAEAADELPADGEVRSLTRDVFFLVGSQRPVLSVGRGFGWEVGRRRLFLLPRSVSCSAEAEWRVGS